METIKIWNERPSGKQLDEICERLISGEIMIYPTDTLYAIGCDALNVKAVERICRLKNINPDKTHLSIICSSISHASEYARIDNRSFEIMKSNTPGAFTFLFRAASTLPKAFKGRKIVGIRIPDMSVTLAIVERLGRPLLTTSVEIDDDDYTINPELLAEFYDGRVDFIVEGEEGDTIPSTIIDCTSGTPEITRQGKGVL